MHFQRSGRARLCNGSVAAAGSVAIALSLVAYTRALDLTIFLIVVPLPLVLYYTFRTTLGRLDDQLRHLANLNRQYQATIEALAHAVDAKDQVTRGHVLRVQRMCLELARALGVQEEAEVRALEAAALLHDVGKLAVPEHILNKPGELTAAEFDQMKLHVTVGVEILSSVEFPDPVVPIVRHHHERWDGSGYPDGLRGTEIPCGARILAVVDCFDALTSDRPYRPHMTTEDALQIIVARRGTMYDPAIVDAFLKAIPGIAEAVPAPLSDGLLTAIINAGQPSSDPSVKIADRGRRTPPGVRIHEFKAAVPPSRPHRRSSDRPQ